MSIKGTISLDCDNCIDSVTVDIQVLGKALTPMSIIRKDAEKKGWHVGRICLCPECQSQIELHCDTCDHFEGNKSMGKMICRLDDKFTLPKDSCEKHTTICPVSKRDYHNPIPKVD